MDEEGTKLRNETRPGTYEEIIEVAMPPLQNRRDMIFDFLEGNLDTSLCRLYAAFMTVITIYVTILFLVFSLPHYYIHPPELLVVTEWIIMVIFTADYVARFVTCRKRWPWAVETLNIVDLITILPFWIEIFILVAFPHGPSQPLGLAFVRVIRLARVFRVFKVGKYSPAMKLVMQAMNESKEGFILMFLLVAIVNILTASAVFYAEQTGQHFDIENQTWYRSDGSVSPFQSIFSGCWWSIVTLTTVGYGDVVPATTLGKIVGTFTVLFGVLTLAFPLAIFSTKFYHIYNLSQLERKNLQVLPGKLPLNRLPDLIAQFEREEAELRALVDNLKSAVGDTETRLDSITNLLQQFKSLDLPRAI